MQNIDMTGLEDKKKDFDNKLRRAQRADTMKMIRLKRGLNITEFSKLIGASTATYGRFEKGKADVPMKTMDEWLHKCGIGNLGIMV